MAPFFFVLSQPLKHTTPIKKSKRKGKRVRKKEKTREMEQENENDVFLLPIEYIDCKEIPEHLFTDLEFVQTKATQEKEKDKAKDKAKEKEIDGIYSTFYDSKPINNGRILPRMAKLYCPNTNSGKAFLQQTQQLLKTIALKEKEKEGEKEEKKNTFQSLFAEWCELKNETSFHDKYGFIGEPQMLQWINSSSTVMWYLSMMDLFGPVLTIVFPLFALIAMFVVFYCSSPSASFSFSSLSTVFQQVMCYFKSNPVCQLLNGARKTTEHYVYLFVSIGFYLFNIYNNLIASYKFYTNYNKIVSYLNKLHRFCELSLAQVDQFAKMIEDLDATEYLPFAQNIKNKAKELQKLKDMTSLSSSYSTSSSFFSPFSPFHLQHVANLGQVMSTFYIIHNTASIQNLITFFFDFDEYISILLALNKHIKKQDMQFATFVKAKAREDNNKEKVKARENKAKEKDIQMNQFYYPGLSRECAKRNDVGFSFSSSFSKEKKRNNDEAKEKEKEKKNMILTGHNASGKTTFLKSVFFNFLMTQQFGCGFYESCIFNRFALIDVFFGSVNVCDTMGEKSLFQNEIAICAELRNMMKDNERAREKEKEQGKEKEKEKTNYFVFFDEMFSSTNVTDGAICGAKYLSFLNKQHNVSFIVTTHNHLLCQDAKIKDNVQICSLDAFSLENNPDFTSNAQIIFDEHITDI